MESQLSLTPKNSNAISPSRLLQLPRELRDQIYHHLIWSAKHLRTHTQPPYHWNILCASYPDPAPLFLNHQIHAEYSPIAAAALTKSQILISTNALRHNLPHGWLDKSIRALLASAPHTSLEVVVSRSGWWDIEETELKWPLRWMRPVLPLLSTPNTCVIEFIIRTVEARPTSLDAWHVETGRQHGREHVYWFLSYDLLRCGDLLPDAESRMLWVALDRKAKKWEAQRWWGREGALKVVKTFLFERQPGPAMELEKAQVMASQQQKEEDGDDLTFYESCYFPLVPLRSKREGPVVEELSPLLQRGGPEGKSMHALVYRIVQRKPITNRWESEELARYRLEEGEE